MAVLPASAAICPKLTPERMAAPDAMGGSGAADVVRERGPDGEDPSGPDVTVRDTRARGIGYRREPHKV
jgi:hypothetical protein